MYAFTYVYRGPKESLMAFYSVSTIYLFSLEKPPGLWVPHKSHLFESVANPSSLMGFNVESRLENTTLLSPELLNDKGELAVRDTINKHLHTGIAISVLKSKGKVYHKLISNPTEWYECLITSVAYQQRQWHFSRYLNSIDIPSYIESSKEKQINLLLKLSALPLVFDWQKVMTAIASVNPKPSWWYKETNFYKQFTQGET